MARTPDYQRAGTSLYLGDCRDILPGLSGDAVITDPPYGISLRNGDVDGHRAARSFEVAGDTSQEIGVFIDRWGSSNNLPTIMFSSPWFPWPGYWRNLIVWNKGGGVGGGGDITTCLKRTWELIQVTRNKKMNGPRDESVWTHPIGPAATRDHICAKPVDLMCRLVARFTNPGDVVIDPCMGSGSTGEACILLARGFIGIECDPSHFETARKRIDRAITADRNALFSASELMSQ